MITVEIIKDALKSFCEALSNVEVNSKESQEVRELGIGLNAFMHSLDVTMEPLQAQLNSKDISDKSPLDTTMLDRIEASFRGAISTEAKHCPSTQYRPLTTVMQLSGYWHI